MRVTEPDWHIDPPEALLAIEPGDEAFEQEDAPPTLEDLHSELRYIRQSQWTLCQENTRLRDVNIELAARITSAEAKLGSYIFAKWFLGLLLVSIALRAYGFR
jgi:hypothetical protein